VLINGSPYQRRPVPLHHPIWHSIACAMVKHAGFSQPHTVSVQQATNKHDGTLHLAFFGQAFRSLNSTTPSQIF